MAHYPNYQNKELRDTVYNQLVREGKSVRKTSISGQQLHPQYVADFEGPEKFDTGFGNTVYKTYFPKLYSIEDKF